MLFSWCFLAVTLVTSVLNSSTRTIALFSISELFDSHSLSPACPSPQLLQSANASIVSKAPLWQLSDFDVIWTQYLSRAVALKLAENQETGEMSSLIEVALTKPELEYSLGEAEDILLEMEHPFLARMKGSIKDVPFQFYFVTEPCLGGSLLSLISLPMDEPTARFYIASVLLVLEHMNSQGLSLKDLSLLNFALDKTGYLKLIYFGEIEKCTTDYLRWRQLGRLLYEMLVGFPPHRISLRLVQVRKDAKDLLESLLGDRFSTNEEGASEVRKHAWFKNFSWKSLLTRSMKPPTNKLL